MSTPTMLDHVPAAGDCVSPKTVVITLFEDRFGNHIGVIADAMGRELHRFKVTHRTHPEIRRENFGCALTMTNLEWALLGLGGKGCL